MMLNKKTVLFLLICAHFSISADKAEKDIEMKNRVRLLEEKRVFQAKLDDSLHAADIKMAEKIKNERIEAQKLKSESLRSSSNLRESPSNGDIQLEAKKMQRDLKKKEELALLEKERKKKSEGL